MKTDKESVLNIKKGDIVYEYSYSKGEVLEWEFLQLHPHNTRFLILVSKDGFSSRVVHWKSIAYSSPGDLIWSMNPSFLDEQVKKMSEYRNKQIEQWIKEKQPKHS